MRRMPKRSFQTFARRLKKIGLHAAIEKRALMLHVSLRDLYEGANRAQSISAARKSVYLWLMRQGKSINEIARLFDRAPNGVWKMMKEKTE